MDESDLDKFKQLLLNKVNSSNFQGILVNYSDRSEVTYWSKEEADCQKVILDFRSSKSIAFFCINDEFIVL
jgi:hypothetical protein